MTICDLIAVNEVGLVFLLVLLYRARLSKGTKYGVRRAQWAPKRLKSTKAKALVTKTPVIEVVDVREESIFELYWRANKLYWKANGSHSPGDFFESLDIPTHKSTFEQGEFARKKLYDYIVKNS